MIQSEIIKLLQTYADRCPCKGDQYGSWGPCELCRQVSLHFPINNCARCGGRQRVTVDNGDWEDCPDCHPRFRK